MHFNKHPRLEGTHAPFSASQCHWLRYDDKKAVETYKTKKARERGTILHAWAQTTINLGIKQARSKTTLCSFVNDAIGYRMNTEVLLYYSDRFYGTADAICFRDNTLRIHDLKTGDTPASMEQLMVYAAYFCLEYGHRPGDINIELRIYQNDEIVYHIPSVDEIAHIMDKIIHLNKILEKIDKEEV